MPLPRQRLVPSIPRRALHFDGVDDYVEVPHSDTINPTDAITVEVLFRLCREVDDYWTVVQKFPHVYEIYFPGNPQFRWWIKWSDSSDTWLWSKYAPAVGEWVHVVGTYDKSLPSQNMKVYVNCELKNVANVAKDIIISTDPLWIARYHHDKFAPIDVAFVRVYNRALSEDEILWNYYHPDDPVTSGLVLWLHWDSIDVDSGLWRDRSGYGNHGEIRGATPVDFARPPHRLLRAARIVSPVR